MDRLPFNQGEAAPNIDYRNVAKLASSNAKPQGRRSSGPGILMHPAWNRKLKLEGSSRGSPPRVNEAQQNAAESFAERVYDGARLRLRSTAQIPQHEEEKR